MRIVCETGNRKTVSLNSKTPKIRPVDSGAQLGVSVYPDDDECVERDPGQSEQHDGHQECRQRVVRVLGVDRRRERRAQIHIRVVHLYSICNFVGIQSEKMEVKNSNSSEQFAFLLCVCSMYVLYRT